MNVWELEVAPHLLICASTQEFGQLLNLLELRSQFFVGQEFSWLQVGLVSTFYWCLKMGDLHFFPWVSIPQCLMLIHINLIHHII